MQNIFSKRQIKVLGLAALVVGLVTAGIIWYYHVDMNELEYEPVRIKLGEFIETANAKYKIDKKKPEFEFSTRDGRVALRLSLEGARDVEPEKVGSNKYLYKEVLPAVDIEYESFEDLLKENIILKNASASTIFTYNLDKIFGEGIDFKLRQDSGIFVTVYDSDTGEEFIMLKVPLAFDADGKFIAYHYRLDGDKLVLEPHRKRERENNLADYSYPITIDPPVEARLYDEILVKVGENGTEAGNAKDGDIVSIKPAGWQWGAKEYRDYVIIRVNKLTEDERREYTKTKPYPVNNPDLPEEEKIKDPEAGARFYGVDYTKIAESKELRAIRSYDRKNPILDATQIPIDQLIVKKENLLVSVIPKTKRLAERIDKQFSFPNRLARVIVPRAQAVTVSTIAPSGTCGGSACDYSSIQAWEDAVDGVLSDVQKGECYNNASFSSGVVIDGSTTSASNYIHLSVAPDDRHDGTAGTGARIVLTSAATNVIDILDEYTRVDWLEIDGNGQSVQRGVHSNAPNEKYISHLIIHDIAHSSASVYGFMAENNSGVDYFYNNIVYDIATSSYFADTTGVYAFYNDHYFYNNTVYDIRHDYAGTASGDIIGFFFRGDDTGKVVVNNIAMGIDTNTSGTSAAFNPSSCSSATCSNNMSSDSTAPGSGSLTNKSAGNQFVSLTSGSEDFHLKNGSDAINNGSSAPSSVFTDDIDGDSRPSGSAWDIGADELANFYPTITSVSDDGPVNAGSAITFTVDWDDALAGELTRSFICKTNSFSSSTLTCDGGHWASSTSFAATDPVNISYTTTVSDIGSNDYWAFVCDDENYCSNSSSGSFSVTEPPPTSIYRSVGPGSTSALASTTESGITLSISNSIASFSQGLPDNVGVGDVIQYDSDNNSTIDSLAFIHARTSSSTYVVRGAAGETATSTSAADADWEIFRAYTSLANAESGTENTGINSSLRNFDSWSGGKDITLSTGSNNIWNIALYGDAPDTSPVTIDGWTTATSTYLRLYTPTSTAEVGISQRHSGKWDSSKYNLSAGYTVLTIRDGYVHIDGLQLKGNFTTSWQRIVYMYPNENNVSNKISNNIIVGNLSGSADNAVGIFGGWQSSGYLTAYIWNNIIYDVVNSGYTTHGIYMNGPWKSYIYNNTVYNSNICFHRQAGTHIVKNNIAQSCNDGFSGSFAAGSDYNISDLANDAPSPSYRTNLATDVLFAGENQDNFHLDPDDTMAKNQGVDLSSDANLSFEHDINGERRPSEDWDIGADETRLLTKIKGGLFIKGGVNFK